MAHFHRVTVTSTILIIENDNALNTKLRHYRRDRRKMTGAISISLEKQTITYLWWYSKYRWQYTLHQQFFLKWKHYGKEFYENIGRERARSSKCMWFMHTVFFLLEGMVVVNTLQQPYIPWKMVWIAKEGKTSQVYLAKKFEDLHSIQQHENFMICLFEKEDLKIVSWRKERDHDDTFSQYINHDPRPLSDRNLLHLKPLAKLV